MTPAEAVRSLLSRTEQVDLRRLEYQQLLSPSLVPPLPSDSSLHGTTSDDDEG